MKTTIRSLRAALVVAVAALALVAGAASAAPTLGGRIEPARLVWEETQTLSITSRCTEVDCAVEITTDGPGWSFDATSFVLAPEETRKVAVLTAGKDDTTYTVTFTPLLPPASGAGDANSLSMTGKLLHRGEYIDLTPVYLALALILALGIVLLALRWARRHLVIGIR